MSPASHTPPRRANAISTLRGMPQEDDAADTAPPRPLVSYLSLSLSLSLCLSVFLYLSPFRTRDRGILSSAGTLTRWTLKAEFGRSLKLGKFRDLSRSRRDAFVRTRWRMDRNFAWTVCKPKWNEIARQCSWWADFEAWNFYFSQESSSLFSLQSCRKMVFVSRSAAILRIEIFPSDRLLETCCMMPCCRFVEHWTSEWNIEHRENFNILSFNLMFKVG